MDRLQDHPRSSRQNESLEEVWFLIDKDEDGYPESRTWEGLWSKPIPGGFEVLSVPFYLKNVSRGDSIKATDTEFLRFTEVIERGGHNTYRLLMHEALADSVSQVIVELREKGLTVELNETGILLAVDVPPSVDQDEVDAYLVSNEESGRWQLQDGYLSE